MSSIVCIRGLPFGTSEAKIRRFFGRLELAKESPVTFVNSTSAKCKGEAYVRFARRQDAIAALDYHMAWMGSRYIEVFETIEEDFEVNVKREGACDFSNGVLWCRGLPFHCSAADVADFFSKHGTTEGDVTMGMHTNGLFAGKSNGEAWVRFRNEHQARKALKERDMKAMGSRYIEVNLVSKFQYQHFQNMQLVDKFQKQNSGWDWQSQTASNATWAGLQLPTKMPIPGMWHSCLAAPAYIEGPSYDMGGSLEKGSLKTTMETDQCLLSPRYVEEASYCMGGSLEKGSLKKTKEGDQCQLSPRYVEEASYCMGGSLDKGKIIKETTHMCYASDVGQPRSIQ